MRIVLEGNINRIYVQSLCMMFFHGEKFPENEKNPRGEVKLRLTENERDILCECEFTYDLKTVKKDSYASLKEGEARERTIKRAVGKAVYEAGRELTKKDIPWGILTGIRPSKVAGELLKREGYQRALEILKDEYLLSEQKAKLCLKVAKNECEIIDAYDNQTCSMYISIPFCPTRCTYCSFISYATKKLFNLIPEYIKKLVLEIKSKVQAINNLGLRLISVYVGGGTPTTLNEEQLEMVLSAINSSVNKNDLVEFTVECGRPDTITEGKLKILKKYGVNRVSVNPQTLNDEVLIEIGRKHTVNDFFDAYKIVSQEKIGAVNTDLIAGLNKDTIDSFKSTIDQIIDLCPDNVTVHSFSVKKSAQILRDDSEIYNKNDDIAKLSVDYAYNELIKNGYEPYYMYRQKNTICDLENVGYARKGSFGIYNVLMMSDNHTVFGIGAGATTKLVKKTGEKTQIKRIFSPKYPYEYLQDNRNFSEEIINYFK
ncbi:MAG: coproporphyrinogen dehydrogenase HemZ [Clostridia bacterium]|nr:coproporphyrinogen dehydrogenase HemZ [Clostridia bacterium]